MGKLTVFNSSILVLCGVLLAGCGITSNDQIASIANHFTHTSRGYIKQIVSPFEGNVDRISAKYADKVLPNGYKLPIYWSTALGINNIGYYEDEYKPVDAWRGHFHEIPFKLAVYRSIKPLYGNPPSITYIVGGSINNSINIGMAFHSPIWWVAFTKHYVVFVSYYQMQGREQEPLRFYAIDFLKGTVTGNQSKIRDLIYTLSIPKLVVGLPHKHYNSNLP